MENPKCSKCKEIMNAVELFQADKYNQDCTTCRFSGCRFSINQANPNEYFCSYGVPNPHDVASYFIIQRMVNVHTVCGHYAHRYPLKKTRGPRHVRKL